jgi:carbon-monoxide dehydrogenase large subunit
MTVALEQVASEPKYMKEDLRLLTGRGRFVDDLNLEGQAYLGIVRSPYAHARIKHIDFSKASSSPAFVAALTGEDLLNEGVTTITHNQFPPRKPAKRYSLAVGKTRFAGEPVAAILARHRNQVEDLVEQVEVDYEPLPVVTNIVESKKGETLVYEDWNDNLSQSAHTRWGNADEAITSAPHVIRAKLGITRQESAPIEPRSVLVSYRREEDVYEVWATVQSVHELRRQLASELRIPPEKFRVRVKDVGGGFGSKGSQSYPEPLLACVFSRRTGLPVKWAATRSEEFLEAAAGRDVYSDVTLACDKDAKLVALKANMECDAGVAGTLNVMAPHTLEAFLGSYEIPNVDVHQAVYVTNKMPLGAIRGAGSPEGCYFIERAMNILADELRVDPLELRRRNVTDSGVTPESPRAQPPEAVEQIHLLDEFIRHSHYKELLRWRDDLNSGFKQQGPSHSKLVAGVGVALGGRNGFGGAGYSQHENQQPGGSRQWSSQGGTRQSQQEGGSSPGEARWDSRRQSDGGAGSPKSGSPAEQGRAELDFMSESAKVTLDRNGSVTVYTGSSPHGQGIETTFAQLASEELGVPLDRVTVIWGDTTQIPQGRGSWGSRSAVTGGSAVVDASRKLKSQILARVAELAGIDAKSLSIRGGKIVNLLQPDRELPTLAEILERLGLAEISTDSIYRLGLSQFSIGVHLCALTLDPELGKVRIVKYVVVEDPGRIINEAVVEGQLHGGVLHAVGGSLLEKLSYDDHGNLLTSTLMDYNIPTAPESPNVEVFLEGTPSVVSLNGAKGVGEGATTVGYSAVINAVNDALSQVRPGAQVNLVPATPDSILAALSIDHASESPT